MDRRQFIELAGTGIAAVALQACGGGGGVKPPMPPPPGPPVPPPQIEGMMPSVKYLGAWSYEVQGNLDFGKVADALKYGNCVTVKQRDFQLGYLPALDALAASREAYLWGIAQGGAADFEKDVQFLLALQATGRSAGAFIGIDEPDLDPAYDPVALDSLYRAFRARGISLPLFVNLALAVGLGPVGSELVLARGLPQSVGIGVEAYHLTADRWRLTMAPAVLDVLRLSAPGQPLALIPGLWQAPGQPVPTEEMAWAPFKSWSTDLAFAPWRNQVLAVIAYRWSTDRAAGDCLVGIEGLEGPKTALLKFKEVNGL